MYCVHTGVARHLKVVGFWVL